MPSALVGADFDLVARGRDPEREPHFSSALVLIDPEGVVLEENRARLQPILTVVDKDIPGEIVQLHKNLDAILAQLAQAGPASRLIRFGCILDLGEIQSFQETLPLMPMVIDGIDFDYGQGEIPPIMTFEASPTPMFPVPKIEFGFYPHPPGWTEEGSIILREKGGGERVPPTFHHQSTISEWSGLPPEIGLINSHTRQDQLACLLRYHPDQAQMGIDDRALKQVELYVRMCCPPVIHYQ
jgi:hypothetical protein